MKNRYNPHYRLSWEHCHRFSFVSASFFKKAIFLDQFSLEEKILHSLSFSPSKKEVAFIKIQDCLGEDHWSELISSSQSRFISFSLIEFELKKIIKKILQFNLSIVDIEILHTHPSEEYYQLLEENGTYRFWLHPISEADKKSALRTKRIFNVPTTVSAITPAGIKYYYMI